MVRLLLSLFLVPLFISCSGNSGQFLIEDYKQADEESTIALYTIESETHVDQFSEHTFGRLRPTERNHITDRLSSLLARTTSAEIKGLLNSPGGSGLNETEFELREFEVPSGTFNLITPVTGSKLTSSELSPRYVIILDQFQFNVFRQNVGGDSYAGSNVEVRNRVRFETKYAIWDNDRGDAIAWGEVDSDHLLLSNSQELFDILLERAMERIVDQSPFPPQRRSRATAQR